MTKNIFSTAGDEVLVRKRRPVVITIPRFRGPGGYGMIPFARRSGPTHVTVELKRPLLHTHEDYAAMRDDEILLLWLAANPALGEEIKRSEQSPFTFGPGAFIIGVISARLHD